MNLNPEPFEMINAGIKTIELRLNDEKRQKIRIGDEIEFTDVKDSNKKLIVSVVALHKFNSFTELYEKLPLLKCGYTEQDISTAKPEDMEFYYSKDTQEQYGGLGFEIIKRKDTRSVKLWYLTDLSKTL